MKATATIYDLDNGIGVCLLEAGVNAWVGEVRFHPLRVMPQTVKEVVGTSVEEVVVDNEATPQDRVDQTASGIARFRARLDEFEKVWLLDADGAELRREIRAALADLDGLLKEIT